MSSYSVEYLIEKFSQRQLKSKQPTPYSIFLEVNSSKIYSDLKRETGKRPNLPDVRLKFRHEWDFTSPTEKSKYETAAIRLGYIPRTPKIIRNNPPATFKNRIRNKNNL